MAVIAASFGIGAAVGRDLGAEVDALIAAGGSPRLACRPIGMHNLPPGKLTTTGVGTFVDLPMQWGPRTGYVWDVTSLTVQGFTAGTVVVTKNAPAVDTASNPIAIEYVASFTSAGIVTFPQHGMPLLDFTERLVFTVTSALTVANTVLITGTVIAIPVERMSEYLS
jgi:hypothetical protein